MWGCVVLGSTVLKHTLSVLLWNVSLRFPVVTVSEGPNVLTWGLAHRFCSLAVGALSHALNTEKYSCIITYNTCSSLKCADFHLLGLISQSLLLCGQKVWPLLCNKCHFPLPLPFWKAAVNSVKFSIGAMCQISAECVNEPCSHEWHTACICTVWTRHCTEV